MSHSTSAATRAATPPPRSATTSAHSGEVYAVSLPDAGTTLVRRFLSASDPDRGLVVIPITPAKVDNQRLTLHLTILEALGKDKSVAVRVWRRRTHIAQQCVAWLIAHAIRDLVLIHSEWMHSALIKDVVMIAAQVPMNVTLIMSPGPTESQVIALADWCLPQPTPRLPDTLAEALSNPPASRTPVPAAFDGPLPASDPFTFLTACKRLLAPDQRRQVETWYGEYVAWAVQRCPTNGPLKGIANWLWTSMALVGRSNTELTVFLRAVQLVLAERNVLLRIDVGKLAASSSMRPTRLNTDPAWRTIRGYRFPEQAATLVLSQMGVSLQELLDLTLADANGFDGNALTVGQEIINLPKRAAVHLRALMAQHAQLGSRPTTRLLAGPSGPMDLNEITWMVARGGHRHDLAAQTVRNDRTCSPAVLAKLRKYGIYLRDDR